MCALVNNGKSKVVIDAARIPTLTFAVGAQFVVDADCDGKVCAVADISSSLKTKKLDSKKHKTALRLICKKTAFYFGARSDPLPPQLRR